MKVTVCEMREHGEGLERDWEALATHVADQGSDFVLLPEMPFYPWLPGLPERDPGLWDAAVESHERWMERLSDLAPAVVAGTRPVRRDGRPLNEAFLWSENRGPVACRAKRYLPDEAGFHEATWYDPSGDAFAPVELPDLATPAGKPIRVGFTICTEMWFLERARAYGRHGVHLLLVPRATPGYSVEKWVAGGRTAAVVAGAWCLSSNRRGTSQEGRIAWSGNGWIAEPEEGGLLGTTAAERRFLSLEVDPRAAEAAKETYPRYVEG